MISCNEYDYVEIVCMYHYPIKLTMKKGEVTEGIALDTQLNTKREECIKVDVDGKECIIPLNTISSLEVCIENPHLQKVSFS